MRKTSKSWNSTLRRKTPLKSGGPIKRKPPKAKSPYKKAKEAAWAAFSLFIVTRDAIRTTGDWKQGKCVTCGKVVTTRGKGRMQAGHWLGGRTGANLFEENACHGQCMGCNMYGAGKQYVYEKFMTARYGHEEMDRIVLQANTSRQWKTWELEDLAEKYTRLTKEMESLTPEGQKALQEALKDPDLGRTT